MPDQDNGNGRVTLAVLGEKLDNIEEKLNRALSRLDCHDIDITSLKIGQAETNTRINVLSSANALLSAALTGIMAVFGLGPKP